MESYRNIIIGFGKGGKTLAKFLATRGETVALIEQSPERYGGTCINVACIPSKSLIVNGQRSVPFDDAVATKQALVEKLRAKNYQMVAAEDTATVIDGQAHFLSDTEVEVTTPDGTTRMLAGERFFINTGSVSLIPDIDGVRESRQVLTSTEAMELPARPRHLAIIGSGYIGLEFASMFRSFGSEVTVIDSHNSFLPREDDDVAQRVHKDMEARGIRFVHGVAIKRITDTAEGVEVLIAGTDGERAIAADKVLVATGRRPNIEGLGLENTSVELTEKGAVRVNERLETTAPNIWALGDVRGGLQFTYISLDDFRIVSNQLYGDGRRSLSEQDIVPYSVFITPPLSHVGLTEKAAQKQGVAYKLFTLEASAIPKAQVLGEPRGLLKALVDPATDEILGATLYAEESYELINLIALAMRAHLPYTSLRDQIYTHPTMTEALNDLFK